MKNSLSKSLISLLIVFAPIFSFAMQISSFSGVPIKGDMILTPAKIELSMDSGSKSIQYINIINRLGVDAVFNLDTEDFSPASERDGGVALGRAINVSSSLMRYISFDKAPFVLKHGQGARIPITINLPNIVRPGGLYGAVLISGIPIRNESGATKVVTRLGTLFFVKVNGTLKPTGVLKNVIFNNGQFVIQFKNDGDIYLNPYGIIDIYDSEQRLVRQTQIDPWFVLPGSSRTRTITISNLSAGSYIANIALNRGYENIIDNKSISFEILAVPSDYIYKFLLVFIVVVCLALFLYKRL